MPRVYRDPYNLLVPEPSRPTATWTLPDRILPLGPSTTLMGILNVTPDSFSDGGQFSSMADAVAAALRMLDDGAVIIDIGGESTRPGTYETISTQQEADRVLPVIESILQHRPDALLSIDTYRAETAQLAVRAGVQIVNDVSGLLWDPAMAETCAALSCGLVLMHTRGRPADWHALPPLAPAQVVPLVVEELRERLATALSAGIDRDRIVIDPGFGFGKVFDENYALLAGLDHLHALGRPILAGVSRKGFLAKDLPAPRRGNASLAAMTAAILKGAAIVRVHDVKASVEAAKVADAIRSAAALL